MPFESHSKVTRFPCVVQGERRYRFDGHYYRGDKSVELNLQEFPVIRKTSAGAWLNVYGIEKFVLDGQGKRFAHETEEWALYSFIKRKSWQTIYARNALEAAKAMHDYAIEYSKEPE